MRSLAILLVAFAAAFVNPAQRGPDFILLGFCLGASAGVNKAAIVSTSKAIAARRTIAN